MVDNQTIVPATPAKEPGDALAAQTAGETPAAKIDALHVRHFAGTALANHTELWNLVHAFKEDVKALWAEMTGSSKATPAAAPAAAPAAPPVAPAPAAAPTAPAKS